MTLCTKADLITNIRTYKLNQLADDDDGTIELCIEQAESIVIDALYEHYDVPTIFSASGTDRNKSVLRWIKYIALYDIFERSPDEQVPDRVVKNYYDTMEILKEISAGKISVNLPHKVVINCEGEVKTKFRGGGMLNRQIIR